MSSVTDFGRELLRTGDLDPVYVALHGAQLDRPTLARFCIAYWCFYHVGLAAAMAEIKSPKKYWEAMMKAAVNEGFDLDSRKPFPRGGERRHYRGAQAVASMASLISLYPKGAEQAVEGFIGAPQGYACHTYKSVAAAVQKHRGFGEWIAFKIADMSERVLGYDTDFSDCHLGIYKDPRQGAALSRFGRWDHPITDEEVKDEFATIVKALKSFKAPPSYDRPVNIQEAETVACKAKSHAKGRYPLGKDTLEIRHGLAAWGGDVAKLLLMHMPKEV